MRKKIIIIILLIISFLAIVLLKNRLFTKNNSDEKIDEFVVEKANDIEENIPEEFMYYESSEVNNN